VHDLAVKRVHPGSLRAWNGIAWQGCFKSPIILLVSGPGDAPEAEGTPGTRPEGLDQSDQMV
jgi:hypothetical protein